MEKIIDIRVSNMGSMWMFTPLTEKAKNWVEENLPLEPWQWMGNSFCVDHRPANDLATGMQEAGLVLE